MVPKAVQDLDEHDTKEAKVLYEGKGKCKQEGQGKGNGKQEGKGKGKGKGKTINYYLSPLLSLTAYKTIIKIIFNISQILYQVLFLCNLSGTVK